MDLKDYDHISIPEGLNVAIEKGIERGKIYKKQNQKAKKWRQVVASITIMGAITTTMANVPILAKELVKIPVVGEIIKVLNFTGGIQEGGVINDGLNMNIDSMEEESIDLYFTRDSSLVADVPVYEFVYHQYPYILEMKLQGVRDFDINQAKENLEELPLVKEVYSIMLLDDSSYHIVIAFKENVAVHMTEYKNPGRLHIAITREQMSESKTTKYFVQSDAYMNNEKLALMRESLSLNYPVSIQKTTQGKFVLALGPYETREEAVEQLKKLEEDTAGTITWHIAKRQMGEQPE